jgi:hypothetical protein
MRKHFFCDIANYDAALFGAQLKYGMIRVFWLPAKIRNSTAWG